MADGVVNVNLTLYKEQCAIIDAAARRNGFVTKRGPNRSLQVRCIINEWMAREQEMAAGEKRES